MCIKYLSLKAFHLMNSGEENIQSRRPRKSKDCLEFTENLTSGAFPQDSTGGPQGASTPLNISGFILVLQPWVLFCSPSAVHFPLLLLEQLTRRLLSAAWPATVEMQLLEYLYCNTVLLHAECCMEAAEGE
ncbi:hypothetical protein GOODEAATRI_010839 [Goodea atripinnis]|uniref:Uncharacterized protein n=1 Tax=Goodea atripinnis TaxID=208336 RepID=A0ABV0P4U3_9TELE